VKTNSNVTFKWEHLTLFGTIEKEYENSFLINVQDPSKEIMEKFSGRMIISKKNCQVLV
jgi:hypothetical protein